MLYNNDLFGTLGLVNTDEISFELPERELRRLRKKADKYPTPGNSCFRKGYHKSEKNWKKQSRRTSRHNQKAMLQHQPTVDLEALKDWAMSQVFEEYDEWRIEAYGAIVTPLSRKWGRLGKYNAIPDEFEIWVGIDAYDPTSPFEDFDVDRDLEEYERYLYVSREEAINLGLVVE